MTIRRLTVAVAAAGIILRWVVHARRLLRQADDYSPALLFVEPFVGLTVFMLIGFAIDCFVRRARYRAPYLAHHGRNNRPDIGPRSSVELDSVAWLG
jgi:hypothetical protein